MYESSFKAELRPEYNMSRAQLGAEAQKMCAADSYREQLISLADRANCLADRVENKLTPVSRMAPPTSESTACATNWMPPLFDGYRLSSERIEASIRRIEDALDRLEI